jgi:hypothetical protein
MAEHAYLAQPTWRKGALFREGCDKLAAITSSRPDATAAA